MGAIKKWRTQDGEQIENPSSKQRSWLYHENLEKKPVLGKRSAKHLSACRHFQQCVQPAKGMRVYDFWTIVS